MSNALTVAPPSNRRQTPAHMGQLLTREQYFALARLAGLLQHCEALDEGRLTPVLAAIFRPLFLRCTRPTRLDRYAAMAGRAPVVAAPLQGISAAALLSRKPSCKEASHA